MLATLSFYKLNGDTLPLFWISRRLWLSTVRSVTFCFSYAEVYKGLLSLPELIISPKQERVWCYRLESWLEMVKNKVTGLWNLLLFVVSNHSLSFEIRLQFQLVIFPSWNFHSIFPTHIILFMEEQLFLALLKQKFYYCTAFKKEDNGILNSIKLFVL